MKPFSLHAVDMSKSLTDKIRGLVFDVVSCFVASVEFFTINAAQCVLSGILGMIFPTGLTEGSIGTTLLGVIKNLAFPT